MDNLGAYIFGLRRHHSLLWPTTRHLILVYHRNDETRFIFIAIGQRTNNIQWLLLKGGAIWDRVTLSRWSWEKSILLNLTLGKDLLNVWQLHGTPHQCVREFVKVAASDVADVTVVAENVSTRCATRIHGNENKLAGTRVISPYNILNLSWFKTTIYCVWARCQAASLCWFRPRREWFSTCLVCW